MNSTIMDLEPPTSVLSQSLLTSSLEANMAMNNMEPKKNQYDALKMKYFLSLGMNRPAPQMSSSVPVQSFMSMASPTSNLETALTSNNNSVKQPRHRTKTAPSPKNETSEDGIIDYRKRTTSVPIPIGMLPSSNGIPVNSNTSIPNVSISLGTYLTAFDDEEDDSEHTALNSSTNSISKQEREEDDDVDIFDDDENLNFGFDQKSLAGKQSDSPVKFIPPHEMMANSKKDFNVGTAHSVAVWEQRRRKFI